MDEFLRAIAQYPIVLAVIGILISLVFIITIFIYLVAFLQGREISFGKFKIGVMPIKSDKRIANITSKTKDTKDNKLSIDCPKVEWPPSQPSIKSLLVGAKSSLLLLGTSLSRAMHDDLFLYRDWLDANSERKIGLLFLNPNSPHSSGRTRLNVTRSSSAEIISSLKIAYSEKNQHKRLLPAIYEGPFRYSARASDFGQRKGSGESKIDIVTSSNTRGTSMGFYISLSSKATPDAYNFYSTDLLQIWNGALANHPGHGISMVYRSDTQLDSNAIQNTINEFMKGLGRDNYSLHPYSSEQFHITLSSICRTQSQPFLPPLRIGNSVSDEFLPRHFGDYLLEFVQLVSSYTNKRFFLAFDQLTLDNTGQVRLESSKNLQTDFSQFADNIREKQVELISKYTNQYPNEPWDAKVKLNSEHRFLPRYNNFLPHITIGVVLDHTHGLPERMTGKTYTIGLVNSLEVILEEPLLVHYAYRSLLRCVGEYAIPLDEGQRVSSATILQKLSIDLEL